MSRRPRYREEDFPPAGTAFAAPTDDGRFVAGRVLRREYHGGAQAVLIAGSSWVGNQLPSPDLPALTEILILSHHMHQLTPNVFWTFELMPLDFVIVGVTGLSGCDLAVSSGSFGGWQSVRQAVTQWRWDNDREALLRDEARQAEEKAEVQRHRAAARDALMKSLTLDSLLDRVWFASWNDDDARIPVRECRAVVAKLVAELRAEAKLSQAVVKRHLRHCVRELNRLNTNSGFIATIEREDILEALEQIACAAKSAQAIDQVDQWRDW